MNSSLLKKGLAVVIAATTMMSLTACGGGGNSQSEADSNKLIISWWGNQQRNERTNKINDMFAKENNITIDGQQSEFGDYFKRLSTNAAGGNLPDIMQMDYAYLNQFIDNNLLYDLTDYVSDKTIDVSSADKNVLSSGQRDGKTYAIVNATTAPVFIYNKTLTDSLGITIPNDWTIEDFEKISNEIYKKSGYKTNFRYYEPTEMMEYMLRADGKVLYGDGTKLGVKSSAELEPFFDVFEKGIKEGWHLSPEVFADLAITSVEQDPLVYGSSPDRKSWCTFKFPSQLGAYQAAAGDDELALAPWPSKNVAKSNYLKPSQFWVISKNCKNPKLAAEWINYYTNNVDANKVLLTDRGLPISSKVLEAIKPDLTEADQKSIEYVQDVVTPASTPINPAYPSTYSEVAQKILPQIEEELCYGKINAQEAAKQFFDQANEVLGK